MVNPNKVRKRHDPMDLVVLAREVQRGDDMVNAGASHKLMLIADQIRHLQMQAREVLKVAKRDKQLHYAQCNFVKRPGKIYYLYEKPDGTTYFSMLSPEEWGTGCPHEFIESYRLEHDLTWTVSHEFEKRAAQYAAIDHIITGKREIPLLDWVDSVSGDKNTITDAE
ncbi:expressed hypothetical protein [Trichoplax adhaerens]|uniref:DUF2452 domain-containing protein n=1 Tax=Trichoplax adhaerens TaxID=10228 RepID=B3RZE1_TRIAD|nr:expressed hypothetical protein [Trichoplax adhaerens]EDV24186.1 expressed hypothetical protein [Trichoplax adhaerens]|eukprot:XP_002113712.1 expressed hypothetical protein [Trichoplax adhaerens]